ncbi:MAG: zinc-dependent metalloprotease [Robiginitalea sp.]|nr:zinc-dependent metalloprotease [Robiginitalea sp.]
MTRKFMLGLLSILLFQQMGAQADSTYLAAIKDKTEKKGFVSVYQKGKKVYFDIPKALLERDFLWYAELKSGPFTDGAMSSHNSPGQAVGALLARLELRDDKVFLRDYTSPLALRNPNLSDVTPRSQRALYQANEPPILLAFPVLGRGPSQSVLIDVSAVLTRNLPFLDLKNVYPGLTAQDQERSFIGAIDVFDTNIQLTSAYTFGVGPSTGILAKLMGSINSTSATIEVQHSLYLLPEDPMQPRYADPRVGYFATEFKELGPEGGIDKRAIIHRYRLKKKNPSEEVSEPVQPIVYYVGPNVPERWRPVFKEAIEMWNDAFEAAGFKNAIVARYAPTDGSFNPNDLGHSVIRWLSRPVANAQGTGIVDPRSGEILSAHVLIWENVVSIVEGWYYLQAAGSDPRAREIPLPDDILNDLMRYVVAHEVGHSIGLRHNHRASQIYTTNQLRDPGFANTYGPVASIMSYGRMNYLAQPGDGITQYIPILSAYDKHAVRYGYMNIPGVSLPTEEVPFLNRYLEEAAKDPMLAFGGEDEMAGHDPQVLQENIGSDRIESARLGLLNLQRAVDNLPRAVGETPQDIPALIEWHKSALAERKTWLDAALKEIYGVQENRSLDPGEPQFEPVSDARKKQVLQFLLDQLKTISPIFTKTLKRISPPHVLTPQIIESQTSIVSGLLSPPVTEGFRDVSLDPKRYNLTQYLMDVQDGLFSEVVQGKGEIDAVRRECQQLYVAVLLNYAKPNPEAKIPGYTTMAARYALKVLKERADGALGSAKDPETRAHLAFLSAEAAKGQ